MNVSILLIHSAGKRREKEEERENTNNNFTFDCFRRFDSHFRTNLIHVAFAVSIIFEFPEETTLKLIVTTEKSSSRVASFSTHEPSITDDIRRIGRRELKKKRGARTWRYFRSGRVCASVILDRCRQNNLRFTQKYARGCVVVAAERNKRT